MTYLFMLLQAQQDGIASLVSSLLPFILIIAVFYFLILRPQQKRQKERAKLLEGVKKGDKIITSGGIHGTVEGVEDDSVLVKIADNVKVKMDKGAIGTIVGLTDQVKKK
ncbi:MAG TPA: preprotein translocase subunit YajC [Ignavibacteria bacterium]|nr:preprotein translocase subunit YajC [Ignavibacteria bacterium]